MLRSVTTSSVQKHWPVVPDILALFDPFWKEIEEARQASYSCSIEYRSTEYYTDLFQPDQSTSVHFFPSTSHVEIEYLVDWAALSLLLCRVDRAHTILGGPASQRVRDLAVEVTTKMAPVTLSRSNLAFYRSGLKTNHTAVVSACKYN